MSADISSLAITWARVSDLKLYEGNARIHTKQQLKKLGKSIDQFGMPNPPIVDEQNNVLCGAGRVQVFRTRGVDRIPVIRIDYMTDAQKKAYILADNRIASEARWDKKLLRQELSGLVELGFETELSGFDTIEIDSILAYDEPSPQDDTVELPDEATTTVSRFGDLWHIGKHIVLCGDARDFLNYERLLNGGLVQLFFTDPPYGCPIDGNVSGLGQVKHSDFIMGAGEQSLPEFAQTLLRPTFRCMARCAQSGAIGFVCCDWKSQPHMQDAAQGIFHEQKNLIVFGKTNAGMGSFYRSAHELILAYKVSPGEHLNNFLLGQGGRHRSNLWIYEAANTFSKNRMADLADHPTVKPKKLVADAILDCSKRGAIVFDPFLGSGTTLVACEMTGRIGRGIELDPKYVDVILRRVSAETGCEPLLDGVTPFSVVASERQVQEA